MNTRGTLIFFVLNLHRFLRSRSDYPLGHSDYKYLIYVDFDVADPSIPEAEAPRTLTGFFGVKISHGLIEPKNVFSIYIYVAVNSRIARSLKAGKYN
jgi:hypothetical protein